jgi:hypothetical protein
VRQIDVAHEAEDKRESAGDEKVEATNVTPLSTALTKVFLPSSSQSSQSGHTPNTIQRTIAAANSATPIHSWRAVGP